MEAIKWWMKTSYIGAADDPILPAIIDWANGPLRKAFSAAESENVIAIVRSQLTSDISPPMLPRKFSKDFKRLKLSNVGLGELTEQITVRQMELYRKIKLIDCLNKAWSRDNASADNNIKKMIHHDTKVCPSLMDLTLVDALGFGIDFDGR
jgi:hypothetical protein